MRQDNIIRTEFSAVVLVFGYNKATSNRKVCLLLNELTQGVESDNAHGIGMLRQTFFKVEMKMVLFKERNFMIPAQI